MHSGFWLLHCHLEFHSEVGMGVIFKVGDYNDFPPVPSNFPTCGDWIPSVPKMESENSTISIHPTASTHNDTKGLLIEENELIPFAASFSVGPLERHEWSSEISYHPTASSTKLYYLSWWSAIFAITVSTLNRFL